MGGDRRLRDPEPLRGACDASQVGNETKYLELLKCQVCAEGTLTWHERSGWGVLGSCALGGHIFLQQPRWAESGRRAPEKP